MHRSSNRQQFDVSQRGSQIVSISFVLDTCWKFRSPFPGYPGLWEIVVSGNWWLIKCRMGAGSNFGCKLAGIVGICAVSHVGFVLVHKLLKFRAISRDPEGSHQVFFVNPIECGAKCRESNCRRSKRLSPGEIFHEISKRIDTAKFSIDLAIYVITCMEVAEALGRARDRGVRVRVIADNSLAHSTGSQIGNMMKCKSPLSGSSKRGCIIHLFLWIFADFPVLLFNCADGLMHHKFCLIDAPRLDPPQMDTVFGGSVRSALKCVSKWFQCESVRESEEKGILITGSLNWTMRVSVSYAKSPKLPQNLGIFLILRAIFSFIAGIDIQFWKCDYNNQ